MSVLVDRQGPVTVITINRPEASNALNRDVLERIGTVLEESDADDGVAAVVLTGAGDRVFSAGLDLKAFANDEKPLAGGDGGFRIFRDRFAKPLIAAANGHAVAGGFEMLLRCDLVVAAEHAEFGLPEVARGLVAGYGVSVLPRRIPIQTVLELSLVGNRISASRAHELGLVNHVVPRGEAVDAAVALAGQIAANGPLALRLTKALAYAEEDDRARAVWDRITQATQVALASEDAKEGARAFVEKRAPRWTGR
jgi:enoyl-CoA hydratase